MFRRRSPATARVPDDSSADGDTQTTGEADAARSRTQGKGRPTPKRREAQGRRPPIHAPQDRKAAYRQVKERQRAERRRARAGLAAGDERYLPARDKGPVRKLARDYVDSRRGVSEYFLIVALVIIGLTAVPVTSVQVVAYNIAFPLLLIVIVTEGVLTSRKVKRLAEQRYPNESTRGAGFYAATRGLQIRRLRIPPPRVKPGQRI